MGHDTGGTRCPVAPAEPGLADSLGSEGLDSFLKIISTLCSIISTSEPEPLGRGTYSHQSFPLCLTPVLIFAFLGLRPPSRYTV